MGIAGQCTAVLHLHHTQQLVQVQGSASRWFVDTFLRQLFTTQAKSKDVVIADLNRIFEAAVKSKPQGHVAGQGPKHCSHCNSKFRTNAKPAICGNCGKCFHNTKQTKCYLNHVCVGVQQLPRDSSNPSVTQSEPTTAVPPVTSSLVSNSPNNSVQSISYLPRSSSSFPPEASTSATQVQESASSHHQGGGDSSAPLSLASAQSLVLSSAPPPYTRPTCRPNSSDLDPTAPQFTSQERRQQKSKTSETVQKSEFTLLKQELVIAKTKMLQLESENRDLTRKSKILADTIKIYESDQTQDLRHKYFGSTSPSGPPMSVPGTSAESSTTPLQGPTTDRLINYFLDILQATTARYPLLTSASSPRQSVTTCTYTMTPPPPATAPATHSQASAGDNVGYAQPQPSESCPQESSVESDLVSDVSSATIDEFMEINQVADKQSQPHLNSKELTTQ